MITDKRLSQLAFDPRMCNISKEVQEALRELVDSRAVIRGFMHCMHKWGMWEDGCFYYNGVSASELQQTMNMASSIREKDTK